MRKRLYEIICLSKEDDTVGHIYDLFMIATIIISMIPLAFKTENTFFSVIDIVTVIIFIIDYFFRLITADYGMNSKNPLCFAFYIFTPMAMIDLISILPSLTILNSSFKLFKLLRLLRTAKVFRVLKFLRYSKSVVIITNVLRKERTILTAVATMAVLYILASALVIFNVEPDSFNSYFDAVYWATVSLTTVGYGDISPSTMGGRLVTMVSSIFGIAIIALPSGIITGGYLTEMHAQNKILEDEDKKGEEFHS